MASVTDSRRAVAPRRHKRRGVALLLVVLAVAVTAGQVFLAVWMSRPSGLAEPGITATPVGYLWVFPAVAALPVLFRNPVQFRIVTMVVAVGSTLAAALVSSSFDTPGLTAITAAGWLLLMSGFPGPIVLLALAVVCSYAPRRVAENVCLLGVLLAAVMTLVGVYETLRVATVTFTG